MPLHTWEMGSIIFAMKLLHHFRQITQIMSMLTSAIIPLPGPLAFSAITSFCHPLWRLDTASAPQYLLISKKSTYWLLPSWQVSNSCSQLHLSSPLPKETILERRQAKRQWLRQLAQTSSITRVSDIGYKILQCMKKTNFVSVVM